MSTAQKSLDLQQLIAKKLPILKSDLSINDTTLFAVYCFLKNVVGAGLSDLPILDQRIEVALDLVKGYLLYAVNEEVDGLRQRIVTLVERIGYLERENYILRANVPPHVINALYGYPPAFQSQASAATPRPPPPSYNSVHINVNTNTRRFPMTVRVARPNTPPSNFPPSN